MNTRGQGGTWTVIRGIFLFIILVIVITYFISSFVVNPIRDQSDCEKLEDKGAHCAIVCGPGEEQISQSCDQKEMPGSVCCQDTEYIFNISET